MVPNIASLSLRGLAEPVFVKRAVSCSGDFPGSYLTPGEVTRLSTKTVWHFNAQMFILCTHVSIDSVNYDDSRKLLKTKEWNFLPFHTQCSIICQCESYSSIFAFFFLHGVITTFDLWLTSALGRSCSSSNGVDLGKQCEPPTAQKKKTEGQSLALKISSENCKTYLIPCNEACKSGWLYKVWLCTKKKKKRNLRKPRKGAGMCSFGIFNIWRRFYSWIFYSTQFLQFYESLLYYLIQLGTKNFVKGNKVKTQFRSCFDRRS